METQYDAFVIGAGLTGLTTAFYLKRKGKKVLVIEKNDRVGGVISTKEKNGFLFEQGPNTGILGSIEIVDLIEDLGSAVQLEVGNENVKKRFILKGTWQQLPSGLGGGISTPLFTTKDKFRILGEAFRSPGKNENETLAEMVRRRMGESFLNYAIDPFILGVYAGDPSYLVTKYALPKLYNLEHDYGSFIGGSIKKMFKAKDKSQARATRKVFSVSGGLSNLTNAIADGIGKEHIILGASNLKINQTDNGYELSFNSNNEAIKVNAKNVITTVPAFELSSFLPFVEKEIITKTENVFYAPVVEVALGFKTWNGIDLNGFGGLIPHIENRDLLGVMYMSSLFKNRAPENGALISIFIGGARKANLTKLPQIEIEKIVEKEMTELMGLKNFNPDLFELIWHNKAIPQYGIESGERFDSVETIKNKYPGLYIGGNLCDGIGMAEIGRASCRERV
jgi:oxygen-dependent protoporphyrinogen oxidase